jgi:hypothetical protein
MTLDREARLELLTRALALESRSFVEYLARTAPPYDIDKHPEVAAALEFIVRDEDAIIEDLVGLTDDEGGNPEVRATFDLRLSSYNYLATSYTLRVIKEQLEKNLAALNVVIEESAGAPDIAETLRGIRARKQQHLATVERLHATVASARAASATSAPAPAPAPAPAAAPATAKH